MKRVWAAAALAALTFAAPAHAQDSFWEARVTDAGTPALMTAGESGTRFYRCRAGAADCDAEPLRSLSPGSPDLSSAAPGDVFLMRRFENGALVQSAFSRGWEGPVTAVQAPAVEGTAAVGATVTPIAGRWTGGWAWPWRGVTAAIAVCRTAAGSDCVIPAVGPVKLEARYAGWYAFALSSFSSGHTNAVSAVAETKFPRPIGQITTSLMLAASAPAGPITAPAATVRARALRHDHRLSVARVTCPVLCSVQLIVSGGGKTARRKLHVTGTKALTIAPRHGRLKVTVVVDGKTLASEVSRAR